MTPAPERVAALLGDARSVAVVVADDQAHPDLALLEAPGRAVRVHEVLPRSVALHDALSAHGHVDAVVDLARGPGAVRRLPVLVAHLRRGGVLVMALPRGARARAALLELVQDVRDLRGSGELDPPSRRRDRRAHAVRDRHALAASVTDLDVEDGLLVLRTGVATWSVVPESRMDDLLAATPDLGLVLARREPERRATTAPLVSSWAEEPPAVVHDAPALSLRSYDDAVVAPRMVAHVRDLVLPQSFRNTARPRPRTPALTDWSKWTVRVPPELDPDGPPPVDLPGTWLHLDNVLRGHFGHAMTEQVSHLWAWPEVLARHPDAGVLVTDAERPVAAWELELLEAAGVPRERVRAVGHPVRVEHLLAATPGYVILEHVHPSLRGLYAATGDALERRSGLETTPRRIFVTRSGDKRRCHQAADVEALAVRHGFTLVAPDEHPLADQVAMARHAEAVAGYGGSGMFHLLLGGAPRPLVVVSHTGYHVWNEKAIAALWDHPITIVRGTPDVTTAQFSTREMHADYTLDPDREIGLLADTLAAL